MTTLPPFSKALDEALKNWHQTGCPYSSVYGKCDNPDCGNEREKLSQAITAAHEADILAARKDEVEKIKLVTYRPEMVRYADKRLAALQSQGEGKQHG